MLNKRVISSDQDKWDILYTVQVEELKEFCYFVDIEYKQVLGSVKTRWLSLQPAITRVIVMFPGLKSYFLSQE
jgi:hypothetical protein